MKANIEKFLERFPKDATNWNDATEEIHDLSRSSREFLSEIDMVSVEPVDFKAIKSPAEWNTKGRESILSNFDRMSDDAKRRFYDIYKHWFGILEPTRAELMQNIYDFHAEAKKTPFGEHLISHVQLIGHLDKQPTKYLNSIKRFYESLLEIDSE